MAKTNKQKYLQSDRERKRKRERNIWFYIWFYICTALYVIFVQTLMTYPLTYRDLF